MATIDHIIPISRGGKKKRNSKNCVLACHSCNNAKLNRTIDELRNDGWEPGQPVKRRALDMRVIFRSIARIHSHAQVMRRSYHRSFSALHFALMNHVDILV